MIWAVLDTNVLVSGFGWPESVPAGIVDHALRGDYLIVTSRALLRELSRVLRYPKLRRVFEDPARAVRLLERVALVVEPAVRLRILADDADNRLLEAAEESGADFIVTGDAALLVLRRWKTAAIVRPKGFLAALT